MTAALQLVPDPPRDRLLGVSDVQALFPTSPSRDWVTATFCPEGRMKIGRNVYWYETEALRWIASHRGR